jgi:hypothetical protein
MSIKDWKETENQRLDAYEGHAPKKQRQPARVKRLDEMVAALGDVLLQPLD